MELLFVTVIGASLGLIARYTFPHRDTHGLLLVPAAGAAATAAVWVALLWAGLTFDGTWIWVASLAAGILASALVAVLLPRRRAHEDAELFARLSSAQA
jgi:hypothetical protein